MIARERVLRQLIGDALPDAFDGLKASDIAIDSDKGKITLKKNKQPKIQTVDHDRIQLFFFIYFAMTGVHALHMVVGLGLLAWLVFCAWKGKYSPYYNAPVDMTGLYWHFVDIVWIFLFPLLYLIGRHV